MLRAIEWILLSSASTTAIIGGVIRHRPARIGPWLLLAGAIVCVGVGDVFNAVDQHFIAEMCYLAMFVLAAATLLQFTRGGSLLVDRAQLLDLLAFACSTLLVTWVFVIGSSGQLGQISAAHVIGGLLLVGVAFRLNLASGRNIPALLLLVGAVGSLGSDVAFPLAPSPIARIGYVMLYVSWGLAAVHPAMTRLTGPMAPHVSPWQGRCATLLGASVATPPLVLLIEAVSGTVRDGVVIAVAGAITLTLAITRLADSASLSSQSLGRERGLRTASAALVAAADPPAVTDAVRAAIAQLMPPEAVDQVIFATDDRELALQAVQVDPAPPADPTGPRGRSWWLDENTRVATLICPLWLEPLAVARPSGGAVVVTGRRTELTLARDALEVLAGQAAMALDRINLVEAVGRRDSDLYLRAVVNNTADMMLVIDPDQRIRYASPALRRLVGVDEMVPLATLDDLVHPDDRGQVRRALLSEGDGTVFCALRRADQTQVLVEATYRDLRADRLVQGFVLTVRDVTTSHDPHDQVPRREHVDELPAWVNRRSAQHKFRY